MNAKRAEEVWDLIDSLIAKFMREEITAHGLKVQATALLLAEMRKEREAAVSRVKKDRYIKTAEGDDWVAIPEWAIDHVCAAILREEE